MKKKIIISLPYPVCIKNLIDKKFINKFRGCELTIFTTVINTHFLKKKIYKRKIFKLFKKY